MKLNPRFDASKVQLTSGARVECEQFHALHGVSTEAVPCDDAGMCDDADSSRASRVVVGASGDDGQARLRARALLMEGREVVFVGGQQSVGQLARTAQAEDAGLVVVDASPELRLDLESALATLGLGHVRVVECDAPDAPRTPNSG